MFTPRAAGVTLRRYDELTRLTQHNPVPEGERFDLDHPIALRCNRCGKHAFGPRRFMREAMQEHWDHHCPARHTKADAPRESLILCPPT